MIRLKQIVLDFLSVNCYLLWDDATGRGVIVDPGSSEARIVDAVQEAGMKPEAVILTHAHVDHIGRVPEICSRFGIPVWVHKDELPVYKSEKNSLLPLAGAVKGLPEPLAEFPDAGLPIEVIHTPGHTPGGCCFYLPSEKFILTGDTLFRGTYGRCDFPGGSEREIFKSIRGKLMTLPEDVVVYPGHEASTTIGAERGMYL